MRPRPSRLRHVIPVGIAVIMLTSACTSGPAAPPTSAAQTSTASEILDFTAPKLGGGAIEGADFAGKDAAIWFWAPW